MWPIDLLLLVTYIVLMFCWSSFEPLYQCFTFAVLLNINWESLLSSKSLTTILCVASAKYSWRKGVVREQKLGERKKIPVKSRVRLWLVPSRALIKAECCEQGGNSWNTFLPNNVFNDYMLTPRGQKMYDIALRTYLIAWKYCICWDLKDKAGDFLFFLFN